MKAVKFCLLALMTIISMAAFVSCDDDTDTGSSTSNNGGTDSNTSFIVGTWRYTFDTDGYCIWTFNADGTGRYYEYDHGTIEGMDTFTYLCDEENGKLILYFDNEDDEVVSFTKTSNTTMTVYGLFDSVEYWVKEGSNNNNNNNATQKSFIVGTWRYTFDTDGYVLWTFNADGTGRYYEYDEGEIDGMETFTYVCDEENGRLKIYFSDGEYENVRFVKTSDTTITVYDLFDAIEHWVKEGSNNNNNNGTQRSFMVGTWRYTFESGYVSWTFKADGTGTYYEYDEGTIEESGAFSYECDERNSTITFYFDAVRDWAVDVVRYTKISNTELIIYEFFDSIEHWKKQ